MYSIRFLLKPLKMIILDFLFFTFFGAFSFKLCKAGLEFQFFIDLTRDDFPVILLIYISLFFMDYSPFFPACSSQLAPPALQIGNIIFRLDKHEL